MTKDILKLPDKLAIDYDTVAQVEDLTVTVNEIIDYLFTVASLQQRQKEKE